MVKTRKHERKGTLFLVKMVQNVKRSPVNSLTRVTNRKMKMLKKTFEKKVQDKLEDFSAVVNRYMDTML